MNIFDLKAKHPAVELKVEPRRIVATCRCDKQPSQHRRVYEFEMLNDITLDVIDVDLERHDNFN